MRRSLAAALCAVVLAVAVVSCTGDRPTSPRERATRPSLDFTYGSIPHQIYLLFPSESPAQDEAYERYGSIQNRLSNENETLAAQEISSFIAWMRELEDNEELEDPAGYYEPPTTHQAVGTLSASLLELVHQAPPRDFFDRDGAIVVIGAGGGTITAPSQHAAAEFPAGALSEGTVVTIYKIPQTTPGEGPLPTDAPQYGPFYQIDVHPEQTVGQDVIVAICQVTDPGSPFYAPDGVHDALRLAKPASSDPSELRVLEKVDPGTLIDCTDVGPSLAALDLPPSSPAEAAVRFAAHVAGRALSVFAVTPAYAVHLGLGGRVAVANQDGFSPFGAVVPPGDPTNSAPVADVGGPYAGRTEGRSFTYDGTGSSDADGDPLTYDWDFGDGTSGVHGAMPTHIYADNGTYTITVTVTDGRGGVSHDERTVTVANALPFVKTILLDMPVLNRPQAGSSWPVGFRWSDAGLADGTWSYRVEWGDGSTSTGTKTDQSEIRASHTYATPGIKNARVVITDKDGGAGSRTFQVNVQP